MKVVNAQFSLKFDPIIKIRKSVNVIEDFLENNYGIPQTMPIPDDFAAEAPRILLNSKHGHSQISFSQISVDFNVQFDNEFSNDYNKTIEYVDNRTKAIVELLKQIGIQDYLYFGLTYNVHLDLSNETPVNYMKRYIGIDRSQENVYEIVQRIATVADNKYFINKQFNTFRQYQSKVSFIPNLADITQSKLINEGVNVALDINNRYGYINSGVNSSFDTFEQEYTKIKYFLEKQLHILE